MTVARPLRRFRIAVYGLLPCWLALMPVKAAEPMVGTSEQIYADALTGFAIDGFDPVAYFAERRPRAGKAEFEALWRGAIWRFANEANRDAFLADPEILAPAFGGYDAEAISRGVIAGSDPSIFAVIADRLYLFRSRDGRQRFAAAAVRQSASDGWQKIETRLLR